MDGTGAPAELKSVDAASSMRSRRRPGARPAWRLAAHLAPLQARGPLPPPPPAPPGAPLFVARVGALLAERPRAVFLVAALALAVALHGVLVAASTSLRPHRARRSTTVPVAVADLPVDDLPPDPVPEPPPPPPTSSARTAARSASTTPRSVSAAAAAPRFPGLSGVDGVRGGIGIPSGQAGTSAGAASSSSTGPPPATEVTAARARTRVPPLYPPRARRDGVTGQVALAMRVDERGVVVDVRVLDASPPGVFEDAAVAAARAFTFEPARANGRPLASWVRQTIRFALE